MRSRITLWLWPQYIELGRKDMRRKVGIRYNPDADALIITLSDVNPEYGEEVSPNIILHYSGNGKPVEIEILNASEFLSEVLKEMLRTIHSKHLLRSISESEVIA